VFCWYVSVIYTTQWPPYRKLLLNLHKKVTMKFIVKKSSYSTMHIGHKEKYTEEIMNANFLVYHINWKNHIELMIPTSTEAYYAIRPMGHIRNINTLKSIYYSYLHSVIKYGIIFWVPVPAVGRFSLHKRKLSS
jgi:hypothetical protein